MFHHFLYVWRLLFAVFYAGLMRLPLFYRALVLPFCSLRPAVVRDPDTGQRSSLASDTLRFGRDSRIRIRKARRAGPGMFACCDGSACFAEAPSADGARSDGKPGDWPAVRRCSPGATGVPGTRSLRSSVDKTVWQKKATP